MAIMGMSCSNPRAVTSLNGVEIQFTIRQMDHHLERVTALFDKGTENDGMIAGGGGLHWALVIA
jgi:hypothetical protein